MQPSAWSSCGIVAAVAALTACCGCRMDGTNAKSAEAPAVNADFYVATNGNDTWSGKLSAPSPDGTDGPFATLERARDEIRRLRIGGALNAPVTVCLRGGTYRVRKTIEFTPVDSGAEQAPVTYVAYPGEKPIISGGRSVTGWQKGDGALWTASVPAVKEGTWYFNQVFVNGERRTRARTPNQGYLYTEGILAPFDHNHWGDSAMLAKHGFIYRDGDIRPWKNPKDALIVIYHSWTTSVHFITEMDSEKRTVKLAPHSTWPIGYWWEYNTRYHVENVIEALDEPGEWYLDRGAGVLHYWPMPGEDMATAEVVAPVVQQTLLSFKADPQMGLYVEHLRFDGLSFQHTDCYIAPDMPTDQQGATERKPVLDAQGLRSTTFENCEIAHAGENGVWLDAGCQDNMFRRCHIHDLGGSGVYIGPRVRGDTPETAVQRNTIDNCFIHDGSNLFRGSQGVWIGRSSYNQVSHNEISDFHHLGISIGYCWGYAPSTANHNIIEFNHVHHICNGYFSDGGGIYTLGVSPGTVIRNNRVHDVVPTPLMPDGGTGIYHDEGSTGILDENNIVYNVGIPFHQHYGRENLVRNNVFAFALRSPVTCARAEEHLSYTFEGNIVLSKLGEATSAHYSPLKSKTAFNRNVYWDISGKKPSFSGGDFAAWQATGRDRDSVIADPQFYDAANHDFRLKPTSPALAMGFKPIDTSQVGLYGDKDWVSAPSKVKRAPLPDLPPPPAPPPPRPFLEDFESTDTGTRPATCNCSPADKPDLIQVTAEVAAAGKKCLKVTKVAGLQYSWQPHLYVSSRAYKAGVVRFACDVRNDATQPAEFTVSLRDYSPGPGEFRDGPLVTFKPDGTVVANGKDMTKLPLGTWVHLEFLVDLGEPGMAATAAKTYRLALTATGAPEQVFDAVPYANPAFAQVTWFGFSGAEQPGGVYFVDNLRLEPMRK
ncbi:MAG: hypothetical protein A3K19_23125 [Lentisphaerae bacterium RIFOXYB12_FULL_65_16]|nr:MAG: hypothetical protein A3K18_15635 [Lentisphaerae bacterium RIFOXYA12_64_32]OGV84938.1 MAG: hypothetical protein A3K19_23125 [Lentisphaerae bacterium RIFOXYB12_FULL_65_16]